MLSHLDKAKLGDTFTIDVLGEILADKIVDIKVLEPSETDTLRPDPNRDLVTPVSRTPLGINSHRILVTGERTQPTPAQHVIAARSEPEAPRFPWWAVWITAAFLGAVLYLWPTGLMPTPAKAQDPEHGGQDQQHVDQEVPGSRMDGPETT